MPERSRKKKTTKKEDENQIASRISKKATEEPKKEKNPAAVELGRLGGLKGGKARAKKLSANRRREIALKAARARWDKDEPT